MSEEKPNASTPGSPQEEQDPQMQIQLNVENEEQGDGDDVHCMLRSEGKEEADNQGINFTFDREAVNWNTFENSRRSEELGVYDKSEEMRKILRDYFLNKEKLPVIHEGCNENKQMEIRDEQRVYDKLKEMRKILRDYFLNKKFPEIHDGCNESKQMVIRDEQNQEHDEQMQNQTVFYCVKACYERLKNARNDLIEIRGSLHCKSFSDPERSDSHVDYDEDVQMAVSLDEQNQEQDHEIQEPVILDFQVATYEMLQKVRNELDVLRIFVCNEYFCGREQYEIRNDSDEDEQIAENLDEQNQAEDHEMQEQDPQMQKQDRQMPEYDRFDFTQTSCEIMDEILNDVTASRSCPICFTDLSYSYGDRDMSRQNLEDVADVEDQRNKCSSASNASEEAEEPSNLADVDKQNQEQDHEMQEPAILDFQMAIYEMLKKMRNELVAIRMLISDEYLSGTEQYETDNDSDEDEQIAENLDEQNQAEDQEMQEEDPQMQQQYLQMPECDIFENTSWMMDEILNDLTACRRFICPVCFNDLPDSFYDRDTNGQNQEDVADGEDQENKCFSASNANEEAEEPSNLVDVDKCHYASNSAEEDEEPSNLATEDEDKANDSVTKTEVEDEDVKKKEEDQDANSKHEGQGERGNSGNDENTDEGVDMEVSTTSIHRKEP